MRTWATLAVSWSALVANACGRNGTAAGTVDSAARGTDTTAVNTVSATGRVANAGHEIFSDTDWQDMLDTIRTSVGHDGDAAARAARSFAMTARGQAAQTNEVAGGALTRSADELDTLAAKLEVGINPTRRGLDSSLARLEHAESLDHVAKAMDAWADGRRVPASHQLGAAVTQFELAANDSRVTLDVPAMTAIEDARWVATRLEGDVEVPTDELLRTVTALDEAVRDLGRRISR